MLKRPIGYPRYLWKSISETRKERVCEEYKKNKPTLKQICSVAIEDFLISRAFETLVAVLVGMITSATLSCLILFLCKT